MRKQTCYEITLIIRAIVGHHSDTFRTTSKRLAEKKYKEFASRVGLCTSYVIAAKTYPIFVESKRRKLAR